MAITRPRHRSPEEFISSAPDAVVAEDPAAGRPKPRFVRKGKKIQITLTIAQPLLESVDELATRLSLSRAAVINLAIHQGIERGINVDSARRPD